VDFSKFNALLLDSVAVGLALAHVSTREILFVNRRFSKWFPDAGPGVPLDRFLPGLDPEKLQRRLNRARPYQTELETKVGRRSVHLSAEISAHPFDGRSLLVVECQNVTQIKELEYMIESYSEMVERKARELGHEKERVEKLLLNIMPKTIYEEWKEYGVTTPQRYEAASVLMLDFVGFTEMTISEDPAALVAELNDIFTAFDRIVEQFQCERIKTLGDAYVAVCGIPESIPEHAHKVADVALRFVRYLERRNASQPHEWRCRIGLNTGPVIGSIVGIQKYVYDIFGPGINLAARMEALSEPMEISLCDEMAARIQDRFRLEDRGLVDIKGFGTKRRYALVAPESQRDQYSI